ncbi:nitronate monooxygenase [Nocardia salmonicida]|uniref:Nitronate monooxygenase n=1 Tax=Nocardia salmonicida TaxID=53431 RepID=A0ABZ1NHL8_9NOCA
MITFDDLAVRLALPAIAAPMFLVSGPELVTAACLSGVIGAFPTINARTPEELADWLVRIEADLAGRTCPSTGQRPAPVAANLIVQRGNSRTLSDLAVLCEHPTEIVITSVGSPADVIEPLHAAGSLVFADVASLRHAHRAVEAGADGLILLAAGSGGQTGWANPFAFVRAVREFFDGTLVLAGGIGDGVAVRAAITLGADLAYLGTRFLATTESMAAPGHKDMVTESSLDDVTLTSAVTGLPANLLRSSLEAYGVDIAALKQAAPGESIATMLRDNGDKPRNWLDIWGAGHSTSAVRDIPTVADLTERLVGEYRAASQPEGSVHRATEQVYRPAVTSP